MYNKSISVGQHHILSNSRNGLRLTVMAIYIVISHFKSTLAHVLTSFKQISHDLADAPAPPTFSSFIFSNN